MLHHLSADRKSITIDGAVYTLRDTHFPTVDPKDPYALTAEEQACMDRLWHSFMSSQKLWEHMKYMVDHGSMYLLRDDHLIFHGCIACDEAGNFLPVPVDGQNLTGRPMFEAIDCVVRRAIDKGAGRTWISCGICGAARSRPLFGKDKIATLERDFIAAKNHMRRKKIPILQLIHDAAFCEKVLREFGADPARGLIVNGHVPVKIEKGEITAEAIGKSDHD